jgi:hypothetical protein
MEENDKHTILTRYADNSKEAESFEIKSVSYLGLEYCR